MAVGLVTRLRRWWHRQVSTPKVVLVDAFGFYVYFGKNKYRPHTRTGFVAGDNVRTETGPADRIFVWHETMQHAELWKRAER